MTQEPQQPTTKADKQEWWEEINDFKENFFIGEPREYNSFPFNIPEKEYEAVIQWLKLSYHPTRREKNKERSNMNEIKEKIFFKRWFCNHSFEPIEGLKGFFGITQCVRCGKYGQFPKEEMVATTFHATLTTSNPNQEKV